MKQLLKFFLPLFLICNTINSQNVKVSIDTYEDVITVRIIQYQDSFGRLIIANTNKNSLVENLHFMENGKDASDNHEYYIKITGKNSFSQSNLHFGLNVKDGSGTLLKNGEKYKIEILERITNTVLFTMKVKFKDGNFINMT